MRSARWAKYAKSPKWAKPSLKRLFRKWPRSQIQPWSLFQCHPECLASSCEVCTVVQIDILLYVIVTAHNMNHLNLNCMYTTKVQLSEKSKRNKSQEKQSNLCQSIDVEGLRSYLSTICQCGSNSGIMISLMIWDHLGLLCPVVLVGILRSIRGGARKTFPQFIIWEHRNKRQLEKKQRKRSRWLLCQTKTKLQLLIEIQL